MIVLETSLAGQRKDGFDDSDSTSDIVCSGTVLLPFVLSNKEAAGTDEKALLNSMKLTLFKQYYNLMIRYFYFTLVLVYALEINISYEYFWTSVVASELAKLAFYVFTGHKFRPHDNSFIVIDDEKRDAAAEKLNLEDGHSLRRK
ncbi:hypothetical protein PTKIN_Ptkin04bG0165200 [Pterospermum kingtungense]